MLQDSACTNLQYHPENTPSEIIDTLLDQVYIRKRRDGIIIAKLVNNENPVLVVTVRIDNHLLDISMLVAICQA